MTQLNNLVRIYTILRGLLILSSFVLISFTPSYAQVSHTAVPFLLMTPDARGKSMADGGSVYSTGAASVFYNPANLMSVEKYTGDLNYTRPFPDLADDLFAVNLYAAAGIGDQIRCAIGMNRLDFGSQERVGEYGESLGEYNSYDLAVGLYGALDLDSTTHIGVGVKYIRSHLSDNAADKSFAFDFGMLFKNRFPGLTYITDEYAYPEIRKAVNARDTRGISIGISLANLGPALSYIDADQKDPLPRVMRLGIGYQAVDKANLGIRTTFDATKLLIDMDDGFKTELDEIVLSYGIETTIYYFLTLRGGRFFDVVGDQRMWSIGGGLGVEGLRIDFSYTFDREDGRSGKDGAYAISLVL
ncbi:MAG: PorV/PorQ family protein [candidate division Zixibacteria bacterium]|nr:PorV/PorQ family protein [candidate division Zixibacteria bacterium]